MPAFSCYFPCYTDPYSCFKTNTLFFRTISVFGVFIEKFSWWKLKVVSGNQLLLCPPKTVPEDLRRWSWASRNPSELAQNRKKQLLQIC